MLETELAEVDVLPSLPDRSIARPPEDMPNDLIGAKIIRIGTPAKRGVEGGGLVIDYVTEDSTSSKRIVFAFNERGMWIEGHFQS